MYMRTMFSAERQANVCFQNKTKTDHIILSRFAQMFHDRVPLGGTVETGWSLFFARATDGLWSFSVGFRAGTTYSLAKPANRHRPVAQC